MFPILNDECAKLSFSEFIWFKVLLCKNEAQKCLQCLDTDLYGNV